MLTQKLRLFILDYWSEIIKLNEKTIDISRIPIKRKEFDMDVT